MNHRAGAKEQEALEERVRDQVEQAGEPTAQADPKFQTTLAYTRITAAAVRNALKAQDDVTDDVPCRQTVGRILNRLGYRLRPVLKARPEKKSPRPTPSLPTSTPPATRRPASRTR